MVSNSPKNWTELLRTNFGHAVSVFENLRSDGSESTVLIGPNNEGKSNVLRALVLATTIVLGKRTPQAHVVFSRVGREPDYDWERDFPLHLQAEEANGESSFVLEYELTEKEVSDFKLVVGSNLNGTLPLKLTIGRSRVPKVTVHKPGRGKKVLCSKAEKVARFIAERIELEYIPAVRTAASAQQIVEAMVSRELASLEANPDYKKAMDQLACLQKPVLEALSASIRDTLLQFLPAVRSVEVRVPVEQRYAALRRCDILIDDGSLTELRYKGDGVQSLAALSDHLLPIGGAGRCTLDVVEYGQIASRLRLSQ